MGIFDDLPAAKTAGLFDDLPDEPLPGLDPVDVPSGAPRSITEPAAPTLPAVAAPPPADGAPIPTPRPDMGALLASEEPAPGGMMAPALRLLERAAGVAPEPAPDQSTAAGDLEAGLLTLQQAGQGLKAGTAGIELARPDINSPREQALRADLGEAQAQLEQAQRMASSAPGNPALAGLVERRQAELDRITGLLATPTPIQEERTADSAGRLAEAGQEAQRLGEEISGIPMNPAAQRVGEAETFGEGGEALVDDPLGVVRTFVLRSLPASAPGIGGAVAGSLAGPAGAAAGAGLGEGGVEFGVSASQGLLEAMQASGVNPADEAAVQAFVAENPDVFRDVVQNAALRAGIIGAAGAAGGAGSAALARGVAGRGLGAKVAGVTAGGVGVEPATEGAGEALAGLATEGEVAPGEVMAEMIGGAGQGAVQTAGQIAVAPAGVDHLTPEQQRAKALSDAISGSEPPPTTAALRGGAAPRAMTPESAPAAPELPTDPPAPPRAPVVAPQDEPEDPAALTPEQGEAAAIRQGARPMARRMENARQNFIESAVEQFSLTPEQAGAAADALEREKAVTFGATDGQFHLKDGRLWDRNVLLRAAGADPDADVPGLDPTAPERPQEPAVAPEPSSAPTPAENPGDAPAAPAQEVDSEEAPPEAAGTPRITAPAPEERPVERVFTPENEPVDVQPVVVEADDLLTSDQEGYPAELQPRDRSRADSELQIESIANAPNPARLGLQSSETDRGAPVVGPDGTVESGNGRVMALRRARERGTDAEYRRWLEENYPEAAGMRNPVLVRRRVENEIDRRAFAKASNVSATLAMSETEQAQSDADAIDLGILTQMNAQAINAPGNRDAVREFFNRLPASERAALVNKEGGLTVEGQRRFQNALFAKAYGSPRLLERVTEGTDDDSRAVTNAFLERAPEFARLRERIRQEQVAEDVDPTGPIQEAIDAFTKIRNDGGTLADFRAQGESFFGDGISTEGDLMLEALFSRDGRRPASKKAIGDFLRAYVDLAEQQRIDQTEFSGDLSRGERKNAGDIARQALESTRSKPDDQGALLDKATTDRRGRREGGEGQSRLADAGGQQPRAPAREEGAARGEGRRGDGQRGEHRDRGEVDPDDAGISTKPGTTGKTLPRSGTLSPTFLQFSFSDRNSVFADAAKAAGYTPEKFRLLHADKQVAELSRVLRRDFGVRVELPTRTITRKTVTGRKVKVDRTQINTRDSIDQLLDAYRQFQMMTHILGLPRDAVALKDQGNAGEPITLSLADTASVGALGVYSHAAGSEGRKISLPDRSNSFAHEWGHALDHWLMMVLRQDRSPGRLLSREAFEEGVGDVKVDRNSRVRGAFAQVMLSLFGDRAGLALLQIDLQTQATEIDPKTGELTKAARAAAAQLEELRQGKKPPEKLMNRYFESSKAFDDAVGAGGYFTDPAEMFARAFEAYVSVRVAQVSDLPQSFLTKGDWAYTASEERRARDTFPKDADFDRMMADLDELFHQVRNATVFGKSERAAAPEDNTAFDISQWDRYVDERSMSERERDAWKQTKAMTRAVEREGAVAQRLGDAFHSFGSTFGGYLHRIARRQKTAEGRKALMNILDHVVTEPGRDRAVGKVWEEAVERRAKSQMNRLENIILRFRIDKFTEEQKAELRKLLTVPDSKPSSAKMEKVASALRGLMDEQWRYTKSAGINVGYVKNGWLPRIPNMEKVHAEMQGFLRQARKLYGVVFDKDVRQAEFEEQVSDLNRLIRRFRNNTRPTADGETAPVSLITDQDEELIEAWRKARQKVNRLAKAAEKEQDGDKRAALEEKVREADEAMQEIHADLLDRIEEIFADEAAFNWYLRIQIGNSTDFDTKGPDTSFLKKRTLPAEADEIMADYFRGDPIQLISQYVLMAPRRVEYAKRFGAQSEKLETMLEAAGRAGADGRDVREIRSAVNVLTGRTRDSSDSSWSWVGGWVYVAATVTLLKRATWSSVAEPIVAGMRTGNVADSITGFARLIGQIANTRDAEVRRELARAFGMVTSSQYETVMHNRYGGDVDPTARQSRLLTGFFTYTGLTGLTNLQRTAMLGTATHALARNLRYVREGSERQKRMATAELRELGVPDEKMDDLASWLEQFPKGMPGMEDIYAPDGSFNDAAELWGAAAIRLTEQIIQNPKRFDRPKLAALPGTRMLYGIMGFTFAFHRNILLPIFRRHIEPQREGESAAHFAARTAAGTGMNLARAAPSIAALFGSHFLVTVAREALFNPEKWEEKDDDDELLDWLIERSFSRTGLMGAFDPLVQLWFGIKYQRDLASGFAGAHVGYFLDEMDNLLALGARNSPNTNTAERNATKTATKLITGTGGPLLLSMVPGGPLTQPFLGAAIMASDHPAPAKMMADLLVGESDR